MGMPLLQNPPHFVQKLEPLLQLMLADISSQSNL
jgi:hypothetical protein